MSTSPATTAFQHRFAAELGELALPWQAVEAPDPRLLLLKRRAAPEGLGPYAVLARRRRPRRGPASVPWAPVRQLLAAVCQPYAERPGLERYAVPASEEFGRYVTYCGT